MGLCAKSQTWVTIPDANLVSALQDIVPSAMIGDQLNTESPVVVATHTLDVGGHGIINPFGLQFFTSLDVLECPNNSIASFPTLPESLKELYCQFNQLSSLPVLPKNLTVLDCASNQLDALPTLPSSLKNLSCSKNKLTILPELPKGLTDFLCYNNKLSCLPIIPNSINIIEISGNLFNCVPNYIKPMAEDTSKYSLCTEGNKNGCAVVKSKKK